MPNQPIETSGLDILAGQASIATDRAAAFERLTRLV